LESIEAVSVGGLFHSDVVVVALQHLADMPANPPDVRFRGKSGHAPDMLPCPLMTDQEHWLGAGSIRQQDGQGRICQYVLGCPAEYHLSQSALRVGTLDQKVTAQ